MPPSQPRRLPPLQAACLDPKIWRACAGAAVEIPAVHSRVYYFPQGHLEQAFPPSLHHHNHHLSPLLRPLPFVLCRVSSVQFLADPLSDEVFAKVLLNPIAADCTSGENPAEETDAGDKVPSFAKILTPSDANNGGGFSVPRYCADSIFPALDFNADPPVQVLTITDVHGTAWEFRHIYRGTPRRHLLTTGWSKFVIHKKLVAGDSVVFMRNSQGSIFVGIRRTLQFSTTAAAENREPWQQQQQLMQEGHAGRSSSSLVLPREGRGKVSAKDVAEAAELAARNVPFEVVYYPRVGWSDFVVKAETVEGAMKAAWCPGMRVKMAVETEDSSRMTWFQGTVSSASAPDNGPWRGSPWRMLQVTWDEPEVLQNAKRVSPWQVELISPTPSLHTVFPPMKKLRAAQGSGVLSDREEEPFFPMTALTNSTMENLNQTLLSYETFPAGMQGARHDLFSASNFSNLLNDNSHLRMASSFFGNTTGPRLNTVSTELNIGSCQSSDLSLDSPSSLHSFGLEFAGTNNCNISKVGSGSIQLFGKIIKPVEIELHDASCMGDDGCNGCNETDTIDDQVGHSLTYSKLLNRLDAESQLPSPVEACYL